MKAVVRSGAAQLFKEGYPVPSTCGAKEVLIDVKAAGINPVDYKLRWPLGHTIVGNDFAGVIKEVGSKVTDLKAGDEVYGFSKGSLAEVAVANADEIAKKSENLSFAEAAALPIAYITSLQALRDYGKLAEGTSILHRRVLIIGASGGCGIASLQLAKVMKAEDIVGVCSGKNEALVKEHGATEVIDYTKSDIATHWCDKEGKVSENDKFDVIYDAATNSGAGEDYKDKSIALLKPGGQYVAINGSPTMWLRTFTIGHKKNQHLMMMEKSVPDLNHLSSLADKNEIKPVLARTLPFTAEAVQEGFDLLKSRRAVGKIVFDMTPTS